jgi:hypothetical protein
MLAEFKLQVVLLSVHALVFLGLAAWCLPRAREGRWALLATLGGALLGVSLGLEAASAVENVFFDSIVIAENVLIRDHVYTVLIAAQLLGAALLAAAVVDGRRTPAPRPADSIYGPAS